MKFNNFSNIDLTKRECETMQDMAQKMREYVNAVSKNETMRKEMMLAMSSQFFIYSLQSSNDRFIKVELEDILKQIKCHEEMLIRQLIAIKNEQDK